MIEYNLDLLVVVKVSIFSRVTKYPYLSVSSSTRLLTRILKDLVRTSKGTKPKSDRIKIKESYGSDSRRTPALIQENMVTT